MCAERQLVNPGEHLDVLRRIATQMTVSRDVGEVLHAVTNALVTTANVALARIWLYGKPSNCAVCVAERRGAASGDLALHLAASAGLYTHVDGGHHRIAVGQLKIGQIAETRRLVWIDDVECDERITDKEWLRREGLRSFGGCPLVFRDELVGVLGVFSRERFSQESLQALETFAPQAATAIKTAQLFSEVDRLKDRLAHENDYLQEEIRNERGFGEIVGKSPAIRRVLEDVQRVAPTESTVLLIGETGTGKELIASAIHSLAVIIHDEYRVASHDVPFRAELSRVGSVKWKLLPLPRLLSTQMFPPWASTMQREM
jgi:transcriptional regulator with GAF, ATPase, and Fis domain